MDYKNILTNFWGYEPTFHDSDITEICLKDRELTLYIKTRVSNVIHPKHIYEKYKEVETCLSFNNPNITKLCMDKAGIIINKLIINKKENKNICTIEGVLGSLAFEFLDVTDIEINTISIYHD